MKDVRLPMMYQRRILDYREEPRYRIDIPVPIIYQSTNKMLEYKEVQIPRRGYQITK